MKQKDIVTPPEVTPEVTPPEVKSPEVINPPEVTPEVTGANPDVTTPGSAPDVTPEVKPEVTAAYIPSGGDILKVSITGVLTGDYKFSGTISAPEASPVIYIHADNKRLIHASKVSTSLVKKFASITSIRVSRGALLLAEARHDLSGLPEGDDKSFLTSGYKLTCFEATAEHHDKRYEYKAGSKWSTPEANAAYATQQNAERVITGLRGLLAKHYAYDTGSDASNLALETQKALTAQLESQLAAEREKTAKLEERMKALEALAAKLDAERSPEVNDPA